MPAPAAQITDTPARIQALDAWRGLIVVVMALDHANTFIARRKLDQELWAGPYPNYAGDWPAFLTRWVTHMAAPGFFFLLGVGAVLYSRSRSAVGWSSRRIGVHLAGRGALLIVLQYVWENPAWTLGRPPWSFTYIGVLAGLGGCLIIAAFLIRLRARWLVGSALVVLLLVEATLPEAGWTAYPAWQLMSFWPGFGDGWYSLYPVMPWIGVTMLGMAFGHWLRRDRSAALGATARLGGVALAGFVIVRVIDGFGNIRPRQTDDVIGFLNVVKYPPAISFLLMTLGFGLVATWLLGRDGGRPWQSVRSALSVFGRAPLFFYLTHLYVYAQVGAWLGTRSLPAMYGWWIVGLVVLYLPCQWFGRFKQTRPIGSLWRFL